MGAPCEQDVELGMNLTAFIAVAAFSYSGARALQWPHLGKRAGGGTYVEGGDHERETMRDYTWTHTANTSLRLP